LCEGVTKKGRGFRKGTNEKTLRGQTKKVEPTNRSGAKRENKGKLSGKEQKVTPTGKGRGKGNGRSVEEGGMNTHGTGRLGKRNGKLDEYC